jgi:hypothetical protein
MLMVDKLKNGAVDRCRERVLRAAEKTKYDDQKQNVKKYPCPPSHGIGAHLRERRGL